MSSTPTRDTLLAQMDASWAALEETVACLGAERLTGPTDASGWTAQDHLDHLAAWERSMVFLLQGKPRHEGLGIDEAIYLGHDYDAINAAIRDATSGCSLDETLERLGGVHRELRGLVAALPEDELAQPYAHFLPDEPGVDDGGPISDRIGGNAGRHYREHLGYIDIIAR